MELCLLVEPSIVCFPRLCGTSKFECKYSEDLGAELVDFAQRYLDPMRALAVQYGTVTIERQQPRTKIGEESNALLVTSSSRLQSESYTYASWLCPYSQVTLTD
jgi:hypothetical protein